MKAATFEIVWLICLAVFVSSCYGEAYRALFCRKKKFSFCPHRIKATFRILVLMFLLLLLLLLYFFFSYFILKSLSFNVISFKHKKFPNSLLSLLCIYFLLSLLFFSGSHISSPSSSSGSVSLLSWLLYFSITFITSISLSSSSGSSISRAFERVL